jgi:hypothetical protein
VTLLFSVKRVALKHKVKSKPCLVRKACNV